jgi:hypothetical protein
MALARVHEVSDPSSVKDPEYVAGLRDAVSAALDYGFAGLELGEERAGSPPVVLLTQARRAARSGVNLDTVLRRYIGGHALLTDFVAQAIEEGGFDAQRVGLRDIRRVQAALLDRLVTAVAIEYRHEVETRRKSADERRTEHVKKLLAGHLLEPADLRYQFDAWHVGAVAHGPGAGVLLRELATKLDRQLLMTYPSLSIAWAWLGGRRRVTPRQFEDLAPTPWPPGLSLALGEPERGLSGWRLTHRQAAAAIPIALRPSPQMVRYADVALLATALQDDVFAISLQRLYLDPLAVERDGGSVLRRTLRAYFDSGRNVSSAAAALNLSRQTVSGRLRVVEARIGRSLDRCAPELDTALRLLDLGHLDIPTTTTNFT